MNCPKCNNRSRVLRTFYKVGITYRQRECLNKKCKNKFKTAEQLSNDWNYKSIVTQIKKLVKDVK